MLRRLRVALGRSAILRYIVYIFDLSQGPPGAHIMAQLHELDPDLEGDVQTLSDQIFARGRAEGWAEGQRHTLRTMILHTLTERLGTPSPAHLRRLDTLSSERLSQIAQRMIHVETWDAALG